MSLSSGKHGERLEEIRARTERDRTGGKEGRSSVGAVDVEWLLSALEAAEADAKRLQRFAEEMSGLITDMGDVPDPGLDDLPGMASAIRGKFEAAEADARQKEAMLQEVVHAAERLGWDRVNSFGKSANMECFVVAIDSARAALGRA